MQTPDSPTYENSEVWGLLIDDEKSYEYLHSIGCNLTLKSLNGRESYTSDNKLVFATISGHYEVLDGDYYLLTFLFHLDKNYEFVGKEIYERLTEKVVVGDYTIYYGEGKASLLKAAYLLKIQYKGNVCYLHVDCFEHSLESLLALLTNTQN